MTPRTRTILYYAAVFGGFALLVTAPFVVLKRPVWLFLYIPILAPWSVWLLNEYWRWVRNLGR
jgi:hypothetical protein